ncbi:Piwil2 [Symbiodinium natans]|uniref:Piwil2 protein n=1 Tax=Symbiodinium natans TaxID=878477 RepID=A0A812TG35_9DINO|nr:Piwil2 [Symbiodinium natans]
MGAASVVGQHLVNRFAHPLRIQKVGKKFFTNCPQVGKGSHVIINGHVVTSMLSAAGPLLQLDLIDQPIRRRSIVDIMHTSLEGADIFAHQTDRDVKSEWMRFCVSSTVTTTYNSRVYKIKQVHFDKDPSNTFMMYQRDQKEHMEITFAKYYEAFYSKRIVHKYQPLLEAYAEKDTEKVFLLPELCTPTGYTPSPGTYRAAAGRRDALIPCAV